MRWVPEVKVPIIFPYWVGGMLLWLQLMSLLGGCIDLAARGIQASNPLPA